VPLAWVEIVIVRRTIIWCVVVALPVSKWVAVAQVPYFVWVSIATAIQLSITAMN
jgi:benzodiazapine receptor